MEKNNDTWSPADEAKFVKGLGTGIFNSEKAFYFGKTRKQFLAGYEKACKFRDEEYVKARDALIPIAEKFADEKLVRNHLD